MRRAIVYVVILGPIILGPVILAPAALADAVLQPPVSAPITEAFRAPMSAYGRGQRGVEYRPPPGTDVRAAAAGTVRFAGPVAKELWVTIEHPDSLRTSYGPLSSVIVAPGDLVNAGQAVGTSTDRLHFGVRRGDVYVDPESLLGSGVRARLVPTSEEGGFNRSGGLLNRTIGWLRHAFNFLTGGRTCTKAGAPLPPPPTDHVVILVAGYGSNSRSLAGIERLYLRLALLLAKSILLFA